MFRSIDFSSIYTFHVAKSYTLHNIFSIFFLAPFSMKTNKVMPFWNGDTIRNFTPDYGNISRHIEYKNIK